MKGCNYMKAGCGCAVCRQAAGLCLVNLPQVWTCVSEGGGDLAKLAWGNDLCCEYLPAPGWYPQTRHVSVARWQGSCKALSPPLFASGWCPTRQSVAQQPWTACVCLRASPRPYDKTKRMVVPDALKVLRLQHGHKYCKLGDLSKSVSLGHLL